MTQEQLNRNQDDGDADQSHSEEELEATRQKVTQNLRFEAIVFEYSRANNITVDEADFTKHLLELIQSAGEFGMQLFNFYRQPANRARLEQIILDEKVIDSYIDGAGLADVEQELGLDEES
jgi:FKBP-type peptidyl-prolyl cis-trans isomerase (trigger factor)